MLRVSDLVSGLVVAAMGLAIFLRAQSFPSVGGVAIAPSFYPGLIGAVLTLLSGERVPMSKVDEIKVYTGGNSNTNSQG